MFCSIVISASWLLIKEGIVHLIALEILNEVLNDASSDDETGDERQGSSGEEDDGDIFPKCGEWRISLRE